MKRQNSDEGAPEHRAPTMIACSGFYMGAGYVREAVTVPGAGAHSSTIVPSRQASRTAFDSRDGSGLHTDTLSLSGGGPEFQGPYRLVIG